MPPAIAGGARSVVVLEPRRLAARLAAQRVAAELGETVGETVGHQVRHDARRSARTRILFMTEAVLTRRFMHDPSLPGIDVVIVDEVHERNLHTDLALALTDRLRKTRRPELGLVIMSATVDGARVARRYDAELFQCEQQLHEVGVEHATQPSREALDVQVASAVRRLCREGLDGHVLVFLPGVREIRQAQTRCRSVAERYDLDVLPLHGRLTAAEQDRAVAPSSRLKVILATNVAESSITIDGVAAVVDSGLARVPTWRAWASAPTLETAPISAASAKQRAGRAGRTRAGRCLRLYTARDLQRAAPFDTPEIERADLCELVLALAVAGAAPGELRWLSAPPVAIWEAAAALLTEMEALDGEGVATDIGRRMSRFPVHPRWARALVEAERRGVGLAVAQLAAVASEGQAGTGGHGGQSGQSGRVNVWRHVDDIERSHRARRTSQQLVRIMSDTQQPEDVEAEVGAAVLSGFRDRVARRVGDGSHLALADGGRAKLTDPTAVSVDGLTVLLDAMAYDNSPPRARLAMPVRGDWILDALIDDIEDERKHVWNEARARVELVASMRYRNLTLEETRRPAEPSEQAAAVLLAAAWRLGVQRSDAVERLQGRLSWIASHMGGVAPLDDEALRRRLMDLCLNATRLDDLPAADLATAITGMLDAKTRTALQRSAPERLRLANGIQLTVQYPSEREPYLESYMQDFFGLNDGPTLFGEPLVLHLWAPNRRAEQVTRDLARFWSEHYPTMFKRLSRRYAKHHWPSDPSRAKAVRLKRRL